jgi:uncharacterized lipoprotein YddW (UPF0748 family)
VLFLLAVATFQDVPEPPREFRAAWVATVDNIDWPSKRGISTSAAKEELRGIVGKAAALNLNAIVLQVRPSADAFYKSNLEPWSEYLTGTQGLAPNPAWDPLEFAIEEAHKKGLELHAWFNPYRARHPSAKSPNAANHLSTTRPDVVRKYGRYEWMDPGEPDVQKHSLKIMLDVVKRYDLDGVHIDDYFYPYKEGTLEFPDGKSFAAYQSKGGKLKRDDWRRKNVDDFIQNLYKGIKSEKRWVKFGISPFGIYRPGIPTGIKAGVDQYADLYADAQKWLQEGWCDYYAPQLYWPINQTPQAFPRLLEYWNGVNPMGRNLWPGLYTSQIPAGAKGWSAAELVNQIRLIRSTAATGHIHFSFKALKGTVSERMAELYATRALVPPSPWLGDHVPDAPRVVVSDEEVGVEGGPWLVVTRFKAGKWSHQVLGVARATLKFGDSESVSVRSMSRTGVLSRPVTVDPSR